jgi:DNA-binding beta-propeller fold protein YncE
MKSLVVVAMVMTLLAGPAFADLVVTANDGKLNLLGGGISVMANPGPDSLSIIDFSVSPPGVRHIPDVINSVIGPPTNIAIAPDESIALIANSVVLDPADSTKYIPDTLVHVIDLEADPPRISDSVTAGAQPSGISINAAGTLALVANRADGTVTVLAIDGKSVRVVDTVQVGLPTDEICDAFFTPTGTRALVSNRTQRSVHILRVEGEQVRVTVPAITVYGNAYHCEVTPDGELGLVAGGGPGDKAGAITIIDLTAEPPAVLDVVMVGSGPESFDISPDGKLVAAVLMNYSNAATDNPLFTERGQITLLRREGKRFVRVATLPTGRIPEGVTFTRDGTKLLVQCYADREIRVYDVEGETLTDRGERIGVPGQPAAMRAVEAP